jgi:RHS repeat-associated protein
MRYVEVKKGATRLAYESYTYDGMNRITAVTYGAGSPDSFTYYLDGELNTATLGNLSHNLTYNLDKAGNRTSVVDNNVTSSYGRNSTNQYTSITGSSITNGSEHEISAFNGVAYAYVNDERLASATSGSTAYTMTYDALGRCVKRTLTGGPTTYYVYDGDKPVLEYDGSGASVGTNVYGKGIDEILKRVAIGSDSNWYTYYPQQNHEGSVIELTDTSGNVIERYRYDAFGAPTFYTGTWGPRSNTIYDNRFLFTGREYPATYRSTYITPAFNFYEYRARAYNPTLGRFMSEDPKGFDAGDYNLFRYCHNDPIDFTDPMGLDDRAPTYSPRQTSEEYARMMGEVHLAAQWSTYGAISVGKAGYEYSSAWSGLQGKNLTMGQIGADKQIPISVGKPDKNGLVTYSRDLYTKSVEAARNAHEASMQDGMERHLSGFYNKDGTVSISSANVGIGTPWTGPQIGRGPDPGPGQSLGSSIHSHTNNRLMGGDDFFKSNANHIPGFVGLRDGRVQIYIPLFKARPSGVQQGNVFFEY